MKIGLAYDLRTDYLEMGFSEEETAEFDSEETVHSLYTAVSGLGHEVQRIGNVFELTRMLSEGQRWDLVFNITEGLHGRSREAQVPAALEAFNIPYTFGDPLTLSLTLDKAMTKRVVRDAGIPTPGFWIIEDDRDLNAFGVALNTFPLFVKPNQEGTGKGITSDSIATDINGLKAAVRKVLFRYGQPALIEQYLPGEEYTVGVLGTGEKARVAGVLQISLRRGAEPNVYSYINKELCEEKVKYSLVTDRRIIAEASELALKAYKVLGLRDAGRVDLKADSRGRLQFLEINPLSGLHPTHSDLPILCLKAGMSYERLIGEIIASASSRIDGKAEPKRQWLPKPQGARATA